MSGCGISERPETTADIIAEMNRVEVCAGGEPCLRDYADRIDAAHKREVPSVPSNVGEHETLPEIEADLRSDRRRFSNSDATAIASRIENARKRQEQAHQKELDALNEQIADLRQQRDLWSKRAAELVEKCNEQYAKLKQVGNAAKLREALEKVRDSFYVNDYGDYQMEYGDKVSDLVDAALAAPPRNCDVHTADELKAIFKSELVSELPIANEHEKNLVTITAMGVIDTLFAPATEKEGGNDGNE